MVPKLLLQAVTRWEAQTAEYWSKLLRDPVFLQTMWHGMALTRRGARLLQQAQDEPQTAAIDAQLLRQLELLQQQVAQLDRRIADLDQKVE